MNSPAQDPGQQSPSEVWQAPQNVWQQPSYSQARPQPPQPAKRSGFRLGCAVAAIVAIVALIVVGGVIWGGVALYHLKDRIPGAHKEQFQTVEGLNRVMELTRERFGETMGFHLYVGSDSFSVERIYPDNPQKMATYNWYSWRGDFEDPISIQAVDTFFYPANPVDLSQFDASTAVKVLHDAPNILQIDPTAVKSTSLAVKAVKDGPPGALEVEVDLDTSKGNGRIVFAPDGTVKETHADWR